MKLFRYWVLLGALMLVYSSMTQAQGRFIRRVQEEAERRAVEEIFGKDEKGREETESRPHSPEHRAEGGLVQEAPDVQKAMDDASSYFSSGDYRATRHEIRQALWGVELEMGNNVLQSLPQKVGKLQYLEDNDKVASSGVGFLGLVIERVYEDGKDMQLVATIGNDAGIIGAAAVLMAGEMYRHAGEQENFKQIRFQDHSAYLEYDAREGYTLSAPFGQSSIFVLKGVNYASESDFMQAAGQFSLSTIQQKLGEK